MIANSLTTQTLSKMFKPIFNYLKLIAIVGFIVSCQKDNEPIIVPEVITSNITSISGTTALSGGNILSDGGAEITSRGVCWSKEENPTINDFKTEDGQGIGEFTSSLTNLEESTTYHVRAYATNEAGTFYGEDLVFTILGKPILATKTASDITTSSVISGGIIKSDGGSMITLKGVCWSETSSPTIEDHTTDKGTGANDFSSTIDGLKRNTIYYMRAYALNDIGISYGEEIAFKTFEVMDIDGNGYHAVTIGSQTWLTSNLKVTKYRNGDPIPNITDGSEWGNLTDGAYCDYENKSSNSDIYGRLYNWYAVDDNRNLAPEGCHVASKTEWEEMINFLGGEDIAGGKLKQTGTSLWQSPNKGATNESGFTALPGGGRGFENVFSNQGIDCSWWTSSENQATTAYGKYVVFSTTSSFGYSSGKENGSYVRCIKD